MVFKASFLCVVLSLAVFVAAAHQTRMLDQVEPLQLPDYTITREKYLNFTNDTQFANDFFDYSMRIYTQLYSITARNKNISSGNLTFFFDSNQTVQGFFSPYSKIDQGVQGSVQITNNEPSNVVLPGNLQADEDAIKKLILAYVKYVALGQIGFEVELPELYIDYDLLKILNPTSSYNPALFPDITIKFHDFKSNLTGSPGATSVNGTINLQIDSYSKFLSFTPRYRGKVLIFYNVPVTIQLSGAINVITITVEEAAIKPYPIRDVKDLINAYYFSVALPLIKNLFA